MSLTRMQKRYLWLAGSHPKHVLAQGRGYRSIRTMYNVGDDTVYVFGYGTPLFYLCIRGLFRQLQSGNQYVLTELGKKAYHRLLTNHEGFAINAGLWHVRLKKESK